MKIKDLNKGTNNKGETYFLFYKAQQYRWENTPNPEIEDEMFFSNKEEALSYAQKINLNVGFESQIEEICLLEKWVDDDDLKKDYEDIESIFNDYNNVIDFIDTKSIKNNTGENIIGSIVVRWTYEKYVGYAQNLKDIGVAGEYPFEELKTEKDLITGNEEYVYRDNYSILLTAEEVKKSTNLKEEIYENLDAPFFKWNYFKENPSSSLIKEKIDELCWNLKKETDKYAYIEDTSGRVINLLEENKVDTKYGIGSSDDWDLDIEGCLYEGKLVTNLKSTLYCDENYLTEIIAEEAETIHCNNNPKLEKIVAKNSKTVHCENCELLKEENLIVAEDTEHNLETNKNKLKR